MAHHVTTVADFDAKLKEAGDKLVLVDFYADWCGPCKRIAPAIEKIGQGNEVMVLKVDVEELVDLASKYRVNAMPTFMFFKHGKKIDGADVVGASLDAVQGAINKHK